MTIAHLGLAVNVKGENAVGATSIEGNYHSLWTVLGGAGSRGVEAGRSGGRGASAEGAERRADSSEPGPEQLEGSSDAGELRAAAPGAGAGQQQRQPVQGTHRTPATARRGQGSPRRRVTGQ